jgi:ATP-binding protein involved in chromosome partitioning
MSGYICPCCGENTDIFMSGGGKKLAEEYSLHFLGKVPLDPVRK